MGTENFKLEAAQTNLVGIKDQSTLENKPITMNYKIGKTDRLPGIDEHQGNGEAKPSSQERNNALASNVKKEGTPEIKLQPQKKDLNLNGSTTATVVVTSAVDPPNSKQFAAIARKEKALRAKDAEFKAAKIAQQHLQEMELLKKTDPLTYLEKNGLTLEQVADQALKKYGTPAKPDPVKQQIEQAVQDRLKPYLDQMETENKKKVEENTNNQISSYRDSVIKPLLELHSDKYQYARAEYGDDLAKTITEATFKRLQLKPRQFTSDDEALNYIAETANGIDLYLQAERYKTLSNNSTASNSNASNSNKNSQIANRTATLTNNMSQSVDLPSSTPFRKSNADEKKRLLTQKIQARMDAERAAKRNQ